MINANFNQMAISQTEFRQCFSCNYESATVLSDVCPRCRKMKFFTAKNIRIRGGVVMLCGMLVAGLIGGIAVLVGVMLLGAANSPSSSHKLAEEQFTLIAIYGFFALLIALGLHFVVTGLWMLAFGKRSRVLIWIMWALMFVVIAAGGFMSAIL